MFNKNNFFFGFALALLVTVAGFGILYLFNHYLMRALVGDDFLSESLLLIVAVGVNIFFLNYYTKINAYMTARGIVTFTFLCAAYIVFVYFGDELGFRPAEY